MKLVRYAVVTLAGLLPLAAPSSANAETIAITGATVYSVSGPTLLNGDVIVRDGRIAAVGAHLPIPAGARRIDGRGKVVTPGLINALTTVGLVEVQEEAVTNNASARGPIAASFRSWDGFFSGSATIAATRAEGITTVGIVPQGPFVAGQAALVDLSRGTGHEMLRRGPVAMVTSLGGPMGRGGEQADESGAGDTAGAPNDAVPRSRGEGLGRLRDLIADTRYFQSHRAIYDAGQTRSLGASRSDLEALVPVAAGRVPLLVAADRVDDIEGAIRLGRQERLRIIIAGGAEAWKIAGQLAAAHVPVLCGAMNNIPASFDTLEQRQENPAILRRAGVEVVLVGNSGGGDDDTGYNARNLRYEAGYAVAYGMSHAQALQAVTLAPARVFGVADRIGTLAAGRDANLVVWSGDPFEFATVAEHVFVRGRESAEPSRQDRLIERYRNLPRRSSSP